MLFSRTSRSVLVLVAMLALAGCGDNKPSHNEAVFAFHDVDQKVVGAHNDVGDVLDRSSACVQGAGILVTRCQSIAGQSIKTLATIKRRMRAGYLKAPAYARNIFAKTYRDELAFQEAARAYLFEYLRFTKFNYSKANADRDITRVGKTEDRQKKSLKRARAAAEKYVADL